MILFPIFDREKRIRKTSRCCPSSVSSLSSGVYLLSRINSICFRIALTVNRAIKCQTVLELARKVKRSLVDFNDLLMNYGVAYIHVRNCLNYKNPYYTLHTSDKSTHSWQRQLYTWQSQLHTRQRQHHLYSVNCTLDSRNRQLHPWQCHLHTRQLQPHPWQCQLFTRQRQLHLWQCQLHTHLTIATAHSTMSAPHWTMSTAHLTTSAAPSTISIAHFVRRSTILSIEKPYAMLGKFRTVPDRLISSSGLCVSAGGRR